MVFSAWPAYTAAALQGAAMKIVQRDCRQRKKKLSEKPAGVLLALAVSLSPSHLSFYPLLFLFSFFVITISSLCKLPSAGNEQENIGQTECDYEIANVAQLCSLIHLRNITGFQCIRCSQNLQYCLTVDSEHEQTP